MNVSMLIPRPLAVREHARGVIRQQLNASLWRVTRPAGDVLGYVEHVAEGAHAFRAKRMTADRRGFNAYGDFDDFDEAVEALRW